MKTWVNETLEKSCIGTVLTLGSKAFVTMTAYLTKQSFSIHQHGEIWECMENIVVQGIEVEVNAVAEELRRKQKEEPIKLTMDLEEFKFYATDSLERAATQAHQLSRLAASRRLETAINRCMVKGKNTTDPEAFRAYVEQEIMQAVAPQTQTTTRSSTEVFERVFQRVTHQEKVPAKVPTGLTELDSLLGGGMTAGHLIIVAGRPGSGKTAMTGRLLQTASQQGKRVLFFTLEMSAHEIGERIIADIADLDSQELDRPGHSKKVVSALESAATLDVVWCDRWNLSIQELRAIALREHMKKPLGLIVIDYLQLIEIERGDSRNEDLGMVTKQLRGLAKDLDLPVVSLSQLNRKPPRVQVL
jgi:replicative DNA helicase